MFDYTLVHWITFLTAAVLLNLSPGPDIAFFLGQTARHGRKSGFAAMFGVWTGAFAHVIMAALGLSAILATSAVAFSIVKWVGAAYLIWLGLKAILSKIASFIASENQEVNVRAIYRQGMMVSALNPKVAIFFLAFLPQFVVAGAGPASAQLFLHGCLIIVVAALIEPPLVLAGSRIAFTLRNNRKIGLWMDKSLVRYLLCWGFGLPAAIEFKGFPWIAIDDRYTRDFP